ncbi:hypothetical protein FIBSPDRAFT_939098 [Athelia psychrophila]|uniref:Uncharacterized protein n=1 Tax=Athelia psychrophila TaxID=1759441 RepID=A0A165X5G9_9AGAM|nr:hypothetical protein FIBSPDRAFT_939098 [Fibularhizoctonia sp. CBS 109695]
MSLGAVVVSATENQFPAPLPPTRSESFQGSLTSVRVGDNWPSHDYHTLFNLFRSPRPDVSNGTPPLLEFHLPPPTRTPLPRVEVSEPAAFSATLGKDLPGLAGTTWSHRPGGRLSYYAGGHNPLHQRFSGCRCLQTTPYPTGPAPRRAQTLCVQRSVLCMVPRFTLVRMFSSQSAPTVKPTVIYSGTRHTTHLSGSMYAPGAGAGQAIFTDDVSLQVFMEALKRLAVGAQTN